MNSSTGTTLEPVVSRAIAATFLPDIFAVTNAFCMASARARMWSAWLCVARSGSFLLRCSGYSEMPDAIFPRSVSVSETRTLRVPKSTPATIAMEVPFSSRADRSASRNNVWPLREARRQPWRNSRPRDARIRFRRCSAAVFASPEFPRRPRHRTFPSDRP